MVARVVISAVGADRPGIVDEVSRFIYERGGNLEDSRMVNLAGQFAMMMLVAGDEATVERVRADQGDLAAQSSLHVEIVSAAAADTERRAEAMPFHLSARAMDQPGLVQTIAHLLSGLGVNIESAETRLGRAPFSGAPVFDMEMDVSVPRSTSIARLRDELGVLCREHDIDWQLTAL